MPKCLTFGKIAILVSNYYSLILIVLTNVMSKSEAIISQRTNNRREWKRHLLGILILSIYIMHLKTLKTYVVIENPFPKLKSALKIMEFILGSDLYDMTKP